MSPAPQAVPGRILRPCRHDAPFRPRTALGLAACGGQLAAVRARRPWLAAVRCADPAAPGTPRPGEATVGCLGVEDSLALWVPTPLRSRAKVERVLPSLLDIQLPFPLEDCVVRFLEFRRMPDGTVSALVCAARRAAVRACLERYRAIGADPQLLDHEGLTLWTQSLAEQPPDPARWRLLLCLDAGRAVLVVGWGARYEGAHAMVLPPDTEARARAAALEAWLRRLLPAALPAGAPVQWTACGAGAADSGPIRALHAALARDWPGPLSFHAAPATILARGLAVRAVTAGPLRCNLRHGELEHPAMRASAVRRERAATARVLASGLVLMTLAAGTRMWGELRLRRASQAITMLAADLAPGVRIPPGREQAEAQKAWEAETPLLAPFLDAFDPSPAARLAAVLRAGAAAGVRFETLSLRSGSLVAAGAADSTDRGDALERALAALGYRSVLAWPDGAAGSPARFRLTAEGGRP